MVVAGATTTCAVTPRKAPSGMAAGQATCLAHDCSGSKGSYSAASHGSATLRVVTVKLSKPREYCSATTFAP